MEILQSYTKPLISHFIVSTLSVDDASTGTMASYIRSSWWRHQMETFSALLALCAGNSPVTGEFPSQRPVTRSFDVFFDLRLNKRLGKQSWSWWFETPLRSFWRHCNAYTQIFMVASSMSRQASLTTSKWITNFIVNAGVYFYIFFY